MNKKVNEYQFFQKLIALPFIQKIDLYGSRARKDGKERSDIDLAITCPTASHKDWQKVMDVIEEADTLLKIDCIRFDTLTDQDLLKLTILQDKVVLFERKDAMKELTWRANFKDLGEALDRLNEALAAPVDEHRLVIDGTIQRFEFTIELFWKNFKNFAEMEGKEVLSPKQAIAQAYQLKWFDNEDLWLNMLRDRNATSHTYKKAKADEIYQNIKTYYPEMRNTFEKLKQKYA